MLMNCKEKKRFSFEIHYGNHHVSFMYTITIELETIHHFNLVWIGEMMFGSYEAHSKDSDTHLSGLFGHCVHLLGVL